MKSCHLIFITAACALLFGCASQPVTKYTPGATLKPEDFPESPSVSTDEMNRLPQLVKAVNPTYPVEARMKRITGVVIVEFVVDESGNVWIPTVIESPDPMLSKAAVNALLKWKFLPGVKNGHKVNTRMRIPVTFSLDK
jgi:TonB family protein